MILPGRAIKIVKQWGHPGTPRGTYILWTTITVRIWDSFSKWFKFNVLLICKLCSFNLVSMLSRNTKYFFLLAFHMLPFHNFGFQLWMPSLLPWFSQRLHKAGLWNFPLKKLSPSFLKSAPDTLSKANSVCQQYMVAPSLENCLGLHCKQIPHRVSRQGTGKLAWKENKLSWNREDTDCKSGKDRLPAVTKIKEHVPKWNRSR